MWVSLSRPNQAGHTSCRVKARCGAATAVAPFPLLARLRGLSRKMALSLGHTEMAAENELRKKGHKKPEALLRSVWNCVLCTVETDVIRKLSSFIESETTGQIAKPSYDGVLVRHNASDAIWTGNIKGKWEALSFDTWGFIFPIEQKNYLDHFPKWMHEILRLRASS